MWTVWIVDFIDMNTYSYKTQEFQSILERKLCNHFGQLLLIYQKSVKHGIELDILTVLSGVYLY